jgi:DNA helicase-2/ATP-dependent DNA helicase PcrA
MIVPTAKQQEIRDHPDLDLMVVAPAGCGKTEALALRVAGLIERGQVEAPRRVLVATFTNRARDNIRTRLATYVPAGALRDRVTVHNFHGLSARIFQAHASVIGLDPQMLMPESDWVRQQCHARSLDWPEINAAESALSSLKRQALGEDQVDRLLEDSGESVALDIERQRRAENRLTYDDLPRLAELILANDDVAGLYRNHFSAVVVDEYQDLTPQQLRLVTRFGFERTTYAGDLAQGIYSFAGADPMKVDTEIRIECKTVIEFAESHRSSPAVLAVVNSLTGLTHGLPLTCADPSSWPGGGLAGGLAFKSVEDEAAFTVNFSRYVLEHAANHRIGIIARTEARRRWVDAAVAASGLGYHRWDDPLLDSETARAMKGVLSRLDLTALEAAADRLAHLRALAELDSIQDPSSRENLADAIGWSLDLINEGQTPTEIRQRIRIGDEHTLLSIPGIHLLSGHVGKGQQFDWVLVIGVEDGAIPDFRATSEAAIEEEARVLSVMASRGRHGVVVSYSANVPAQSGRVWAKQPSRFWTTAMSSAGLRDGDGINAWSATADWPAIAAR